MNPNDWTDDGPTTNQRLSFERIDEALDKLRVESECTYWDSPAVGDQLAGVLTALERGTTSEGDAYPILVLETPDNGTIRVRASRTQLRAKLAEKSPRIGDTVALRFDGTKRSAKGRDFYTYSVVVIRDGGNR